MKRFPDGMLNVRTMDRNEVQLAIDWAAAEGWNPGIHDAECFYFADPHGFFLADYEGQPVGCVSAVRYDNTFAFVGLYLVKPEFRGQGIGSALADRVFKYLEGVESIGNDAVIEQQDNYTRYGFGMAHRNVRYRGTSINCEPDSTGIVELGEFSFYELLRYDRTMFPTPRTQFLRCWISQPGGAALGFTRGQGLLGYGVMRKCRQGYKIGPLFADNEEVAEALFNALTARAGKEEFYLDIPEPNPGAMALVKRHNLEPVFETGRMFIGKPPVIPMSKLFGISTFELG